MLVGCVLSFLVYKCLAFLITLLHKGICNFLWTHNINSTSDFRVPWKVCASSLKTSGLGIKNLNLFNEALLVKMAWKTLIDLSFVHGFLWS